MLLSFDYTHFWSHFKVRPYAVCHKKVKWHWLANIAMELLLQSEGEKAVFSEKIVESVQ